MNNEGNVQYRVAKGYDRGEEVEVRVPDLDHRPERWRAEKGNRYFSVSGCGEVFSSSEDLSTTDDSRYDFGNYFRTLEEAQRAAEYLKECLTKFHNND